MREVLSPVDSVTLDTPLGQIKVKPISACAVQVSAPHLTVNGISLKASAFLNRGRDTREFNFLKEIRDGIVFTAPHGLEATLVDGRSADVVVLGKIAEVLISTVNKLAEEKWTLFLEAERRSLNNELCGLEQTLESLRGRIEAKERELQATEQALHKSLG